MPIIFQQLYQRNAWTNITMKNPYNVQNKSIDQHQKKKNKKKLNH